jgi:hypothetical protein
MLAKDFLGLISIALQQNDATFRLERALAKFFTTTMNKLLLRRETDTKVWRRALK